jgi:two-component system LytT family sensor kinase
MTFSSLNRLLQIRPINHMIYWVLFVLIGSFIFSYQQNFPFLFYLLNLLVQLPVLVFYTYFVVYVLVPYFLFKGRYFTFFGLLATVSGLASLLKLFIGKHVYYALFIPVSLHPKEWYTVDSFLMNLLWIVGPTVLFAMFKYYKNWIKSQDITNEAERKRLASELQVLKAQLNPHFLFNTFNNLYVLALNKSDKTPAVIAKISDMFHYILYECNATEVPVSKEIKLIEDYIELERLRYSDRLSINFIKEVDTYNFLIPPMLLYSFVENCFKHGSSPDPNMPWIKISIRIKNSRLVFEASNSIPSPNNLKGDITFGLGLSNTCRRLELIYPKNHQLVIRKEKNEFIVKLDIQGKGLKTNENND